MEQEIIITERNEEKIYLNDVTKDDLIIVRKKGKIIGSIQNYDTQGWGYQGIRGEFLDEINLSDLIMIEELKGCKFSRIK